VRLGRRACANTSLQNWFQNRRAKSKQDVKKAQSAMAAINNPQQNLPLSSSGSDSEPSPAFTSPEYFNMMQQYNAESSNIGDNFGGAATSSLEDSTPALSSAQDQFDNFNFVQASNDLFDSPQDLNRRTLTQEQFNTMQQTGLAQLSETGDFNLDMDSDVFSKMFPDYSQQDTKSQLAYDFPDLSVPAPPGPAEQSAMGFPSSTTMQSRSVASSAGSDWGGSRSSSISTYSHDGHVAQPVAGSNPQASSTSSTWRPGQSVPVDFNQLSQEFRQIAQSRPSHQAYAQEQPLAFPDDEAFGERRNSHTAGITHSMGNVGIKTPQPQQHAAFKSPTPSTSLATRRQRSKPAPLGLASMRSQSYSAASQPGSPGPIAPQQQQQAVAGSPMPIRRIKSSNMMNAVAQGRIQKASIGSAQRSPLKFTFAEAMSSPKGTRHMSHSGSNLVPPIPMSPREQSHMDPARQFQQWQSSSGQASRQASISEHDFEQHTTYGPTVSGPPDNVSSPPHTPLYPPQPQFSQQRVGKNIITENTPPQSAPATQQSFSNGSFIPPQSHAMQHQPVAISQAQISQQAMQHMFTAHPPHMMAPEAQFPMVDMNMPQHPQFTLTNSGPMVAPQMHFPMGGLPMVDANGNLISMAQPHYQLVSHAPMMPSVAAPPLSHTPPVHYPFPSTASTSPGLQISAHAPKVVAQPELFVHEYRPPVDPKCAATPRKVATESGPKNYTFANQTPEHFEKGKKSSSNASDHSPESGSS
jgi:hypothetical protein